MPRLPTRTLLITTALLGALPGAARAATITAEGDALVYRSEAGDRHSLYVRDSHPEGRVRFEDWAEITSAPASCTIHEPTVVDCDVPGRLRVELGPAHDAFAFGDGYTLALPIEVYGGGGDDRLYGDAVVDAPELLDGGDGKDVIDGFGGADEIRGGAGDDDLEGNGGADVVLGGDGNDTLAGDDQAAPAADVIDGGAGSDLLKDYVEYGTDLHPPADVSLDGVANDGRAGEGDDVRSIERMIAYVSGRFVLGDGAEDWQVWSNMDGGRSVVLAAAGDDRIVGADAVEEIDGGPGNDYLEGGKNHDVIKGGPGTDTIYGDETADSCKPEWPESCVRYGNDTIDARDGEADQVDCGAGTDTVLADAADVVAPNCETVDRGGATPPGGGDGPGTGTPRSGARVVLASRTKLGKALRKGFTVRVAGAKAGRAKLVAKRKRRVVATGKVVVGASGKGTARLRFTRAAARKLRSARSVRLAISGAGVSGVLTIKR